MSKLILTQYTDPMCSWCYGTEPALKKLSFLMGDQIEVHYVLGLMLPDPAQMLGTGEAAQIRLAQVKAHLNQEFHSVEKRTGMPFSMRHLSDMQVSDFTTLPMSLAYEAVKLINEDKANLFLARMREATHADERMTGRFEVLLELVREQGVDTEEYQKHLEDGSAKQALEEDLVKCRRLGVSGFPTILLECDGKQGVISGYQTYDRLLAAVNQISNGTVEVQEKEASFENVCAFIAQFERVAKNELKLAFNLNEDSLAGIVEKLTASGAYARENRGDSYFIRQLPVMSCDPVTGVCNL